MKKRLLGLFLCFALVITILPFATFAEGRDPATGIENPSEETRQNGNLHLKKDLSQGSNNTYDITMKSWATGKVKAVTEKIPTDFVVVVDQSGSMDTKDMPTGDPTVQNNKYLEDIANGAYYYKDGDNYYRVYGVKDYLYRYYPANYWFTGNIVEHLGTDIGWFMGQTDATTNIDNAFYFREEVDGQTYYIPIKTTIQGKIGTYYMQFSYPSKKTGGTYKFNRDDTTYSSNGKSPWYHNVTDGTVLNSGALYEGADFIVQGLYRDDNSYTYSEIKGDGLLSWIHIRTGMYVNYPMYGRHLSYTKLCYRDVNGVEHEVPSNSNNRTTWEYCDDNGIARTTNSVTSARPTYSGLYTFSGTTDRITALKAALNKFAGAVANETDDFGAVDNRISIVGFSSNGYNNTELLTHTERDISSGSTNGWQKGTCDNNVSEYYGKGLVGSTNGNVGTANPKITNAITAITANGGTQPEDGLNMAYQVLTNRSNTTYTIRSGEHKDETVDRNTIVIFFTDGQPGDYHYSDQYTEANEVVAQAKQIKDYGKTLDYGTSIFSIGVFGESDANPLTYTHETRTNSQGEDKAWKYLGGWMESYHDKYSPYSWYCLRRQWRPNSASAADNYTATPNDTIFDYMSVVSSNYPDAKQFIAPTWLSGNYTGANGYTGATDGVRHKNTAETTNKYYRMASSQDTLVNAFLQAVTMNNEETETQATLNDQATFHDAVNLDDFDVSEATYKVEWQPMKWANGAAVKDGDPVQQGEERDMSSDGVIDYSGFNYAEWYTSEGHDGKQLIITISGLKPKAVSRILESNDGNATITGKDETIPSIEIGTPTLDLSDKYFAVHHIQVNASDRSQSEKEVTLYPINGNTPFNITNKLLDNDNYLYGGVYEGFENGALSDPMTFGNDSGLSFTPVVGTDYYLKEVPTVDYLKTKILWRSSGPNLVKSYLISTLDNGDDYYRTGFVVDGANREVDNNEIYKYIILSNGPIKGSGNTETTVSVYVSDLNADGKNITETLENVVVGKDSEGNDITENIATSNARVNRKQAFGGTSGDLSLYEIPVQSDKITAKAFWVTHDGVMVTGANTRDVVNGRATANDPVNVTYSDYGKENAVYTESINVKSMFVGADDVDEEEPEDESVKLAGYTTSLNGNIAMNFYMDLNDEVAADKNAYMQFTLPGANHTEEVVKLADAKKQVRGGKTYYVFSAGVAAKDMTSDIKAQFVKGDGTKSDVWTYTIKQYCDYIRSHPESYDKESVALVENMLNYGGYAQTYFNHNTDKLANEDLNLALPEVDLDESFDPVVSGECTGLTYQGTSSMLTTTTGLKHYFDIQGNAEDYTFKANGKELQLQSDKNGTYVHVDNIKAKDLNKPIAVIVTNKDGNTYTLKYSVYTNVKQVVESESFPTAAKNMMKALYGYGEAALNYFATR